MEAKNQGGPAFPVTLNPGESYQGHAPCDGMTLRDYFAAKAMQSYLQRPEADEQVMRDIAQAAYASADAMLAAREKT